MRKSLLALSLALGLALPALSFADTMTGVLIDNHCAPKMAAKDNPQQAAEKHPKSCCEKCAKDGGMAFMTDGKVQKLDDKSSQKALDYLKEKDHGTQVTIDATKNDDGSLSISDIKPAPKSDKSEEKKD